MKKIGLCLLIIASIIFFPKSVNAEDSVEKSLYLSGYQDVLKMYNSSKNDLLVFSEYFTIVDGDNNYTFNYIVKDVLIDGNIFYVLTDKEVLKINQNAIVSSFTIPNNLVINKIKYYTYLYLMGSMNDSGIIIKLNADMTENRRWLYGANNSFNIYDMIKVEGGAYLLATKKGHSLDGSFENIGNYNDTKTIIIKVNNRMNIDSIYYFNNQKETELPILFELKNNTLYVAISSDDLIYPYEVSLDFNDVYCLDVLKLNDEILLGYNNEFISANTYDNLKLSVDNKELNYNIYGVIKLEIKDGYLIVYANTDDYIYEYLISEYHVDYINDFKIGYNDPGIDFDGDLNNTDNIKVTSYFGKVEVFNKTVFSKNVPGEYNLSLVIKRENQKDIMASTKAYILPFVNVRNGGIYKTGLTLYFMGNAELNNTVISNGYCIRENGDYHLVIKNKDQEIEEYYFTCLDDYYKVNDLIQEVSVYANKNQDFDLSFNVGENDVVQEVYIDGVLTAYQQDKNKVSVKVTNRQDTTYATYTINKVKMNDKYFDTSIKFNVKLLKDMPTIDVEEQNTDTLSLLLKVKDVDQTLDKLVILINDKVVANNYFKNQDINLQEYNQQNINLKILLVIDNGNKNIVEKEILNINGKLKSGNNFIKISNKVNYSVEEIKLEINTDNLETINNIQVLNNTLSNSYLNKPNYLNIFISLGITIILIIIIAIISIKKIKKRKNQA